jgi:hypothetical protein
MVRDLKGQTIKKKFKIYFKLAYLFKYIYSFLVK